MHWLGLLHSNNGSFNRFFGWLESPEMQVQDAYVWEAARRSRKPSDSFAEEDDVPLMDLESDRQV